MPKEVTALH
ncbi:uncharacterized protein FFM5_15329 [Fusarium fujikuroi]|nr:uncharacterized protein FFM5_15329 [Fusarium fujikuroi]